eukprot:CAMPEP_0179025922 /NCGR_PEP_ID=MMETSP0796-20121207/8242_1 /TAXON_ID=73915 /ORGANISM="Pyrodinium bahamense, Strain pbaha01" /LENGTH=46 /DNA_ID= /DNA_START= /DNA_END= /DNA_ORIENTATION=
MGAGGGKVAQSRLRERALAVSTLLRAGSGVAQSLSQHMCAIRDALR